MLGFFGGRSAGQRDNEDRQRLDRARQEGSSVWGHITGRGAYQEMLKKERQKVAKERKVAYQRLIKDRRFQEKEFAKEKERIRKQIEVQSGLGRVTEGTSVHDKAKKSYELAWNRKNREMDRQWELDWGKTNSSAKYGKRFKALEREFGDKQKEAIARVRKEVLHSEARSKAKPVQTVPSIAFDNPGVSSSRARPSYTRSDERGRNNSASRPTYSQAG